MATPRYVEPAKKPSKRYAYVGNDPVDRTDPTGECIDWSICSALDRPDHIPLLDNKNSEQTSNQKKMEAVRETGRQGEKEAGVDPTKAKERVGSRTRTARYRIPDQSDRQTIKEVKNVKEFRITDQIRDFVEEAKASFREFTIKLRENTTIRPSVQRYIDDNGLRVEKPIGARPVTGPEGEPVVAPGEPIVVEPPIIP